MDDVTPAIAHRLRPSGVTRASCSQCSDPKSSLDAIRPPHILLVGSWRQASPKARQAMKFYASIGKSVLAQGDARHVADGCSSPLSRGLYLSNGRAGVAGAGDAVSWGPELRWGVMG
jgi:hypothetical protein